MLFVLRFTDHPTAYYVRKQYINPHLDLLRQKAKWLRLLVHYGKVIAINLLMLCSRSPQS